MMQRLANFKFMSKHVGIWITQTDCCDIYCCGINCAFVGYNKEKLSDIFLFKNVLKQDVYHHNFYTLL